MLLVRSSSTPSLTSWFQQQTPKPFSSSREPVFIHLNHKQPTLSLYSPTGSPKKITRASSDTDLLTLSFSTSNCLSSGLYVDEACELQVMVDGSGGGTGRGKICSDLLTLSFSTSNCLSSGLYVDEACELQVMVDGSGGGTGRGKICSGGGGDNGGYEYGIDVYYRNMIEANLNNSLVLGIYAKHLKEVRGDALKAEEYCSRAILANPSDATALSMYADLIWEARKDASRAQFTLIKRLKHLQTTDEEPDMNLTTPSFVHEAASQQFPIVAV